MNWEPINLAHLEERPKITPSIGGVNLVYPGKRHVFSGLPESAKTLAAYAIALEEVRLGGNVLLIDFEMGQWDARDRLREMGATDDELDQVSYVEPETPATEETIEPLVNGVDQYTLVIIDAAAGAYSLQGLDDNKRADAEAFTRLYVRTFWLRGVATIVLDHVAKNAGNRGAFAIGSERKVGGADVHLGFETVLPIKRGGRGLYKVVTHKDRLGHLERPKAADLELRSDTETHALTWVFRPPEPDTEANPWRPTHLMEKVSVYLEKQRDGVSRSEVERNVQGRAQFVRVALDALIDDRHVVESAGLRGSRLVRSVEPYRENAPKSTPSHPVRTSSGTGSFSPRPSSHPLRGDGVDGVVEDELETCLTCDSKFSRNHRRAELFRCPDCVRQSLGIPVQ